MAGVLVCDAIFHSEVPADHCLVFGASAERRTIPSNRTYSLMVLLQAPDLLAVIDVPDLSLSQVSADSEMVAFVAPAHTCDLVIAYDLAELFHL